MTTFETLLRQARTLGIPDRDLPTHTFHPERRVALEGNVNFRDLGGYPTRDGGMTRWRRVYRSDRFDELTPADVESLRRLDVRRIHDFRIEAERARHPSRLPEHVEIRLLATGDVAADQAMIDLVYDMLSGTKPLPAPTFWEDNYDEMVERARPMFCALADSLVDSETALPAVFHCTAGKDRTGLAAAILLDVVGVPRETVIDDYLLTNAYRTPHRVRSISDQLAAAGIAVHDVLPALSATRAAIERAFRAIETRHGGTEQYLLDGGCDPATPDRLRAALVDR